MKEEEEDEINVFTVPAAAPPPPPARKSINLALAPFTCTVSKPAHAYANMELVTVECGPKTEPAPLDALEVRSYCALALQRFLGVSGAGMPVDVLKVQGCECWVRVPREDLARFAAAITAWPGVSRGGSAAVLQIRASGNWLGSLLGRDQNKLWTS